MITVTVRHDVEKAFVGMLLVTAGFFVYYYEQVFYERYFDPHRHIAIDVPTAMPPSGYFIPGAASVPAGYVLDVARYTRSSSDIRYALSVQDLFVPTIEYTETQADYDALVANAGASSHGATIRTLRDFSWNGRRGVVVGEFADTTARDPISAWLYYDDTDGRVVTIIARTFSADQLIAYLKTLVRAP